ncbi:MAG TPA: phosphatase PAP2 family protein [Steroidobacteraceae bacterium]|nr:phosphatase PAP2 family protein [Steroidobacteraceae bacterium]
MSEVSLAFKDGWRPKAAAVLPHEWVFSAFLVVTGARLLADSPARVWAAVFFACLAACVLMIFWTERNPTPGRWRIRLSFYYVAMGVCFFSMGTAVPLLGTPRADALLLQWDRDLLGETPAVTWEAWLRPWLENVAMAGYLFFFYYLMAGPGHYCFRDIPAFRKCIVGLFTIYGISLLSYTVLPAGGPHLFMSFNTPLQGPLLLNSTLSLVNRGSNTVDVFPSVHVAASLYLLLFDWQHWRRRFWWVLAPCAVLWLSTLYLRFHYFVDLIAGVAVALVGWWTAQKYSRD